VKAAQEASDNMFNAFLNIQSFASFIKVFFIMAVVPAVGEEMFFRGVLMRFARQRSRTMVFPIIFTAVVFAYSHTNIYGYLSIFSAGVLLAVIYNLTGSIWCSILGHLSFNGMQVTLSYLGNHSPSIKAFMASNTVPIYLIIGGAVVFGLSFYLLLKNKTPLPDNWSDNFIPGELSEKAD
jgi:membrane protease YdiL (CAAX protease family)